MNIKEARQLAGLTQAQVFDLLGIPIRTLQNWENGQRQCPEWCERLIVDKLKEMNTMTASTYMVTRYDVNTEFYVEVTNLNSGVEFYLCKQNHSTKQLMFGLHSVDCPKETWESLIESNVYDYFDLFE